MQNMLLVHLFAKRDLAFSSSCWYANLANKEYIELQNEDSDSIETAKKYSDQSEEQMFWFEISPFCDCFFAKQASLWK